MYLDIAGRIPTIEEAQAYIHSKEPQKRAKLIDTLLASDGYTSHMFNYWADVLRLTDNVKGRITAEAYEEWLKKQVKENVPYDQFVKNLLTTDGGVWDSGSIGFWQRDENKLDHLAYTVQVFLGTSIVCAQCHNHPFDKWSQMDYYQMAAHSNGIAIACADRVGIERGQPFIGQSLIVGGDGWPLAGPASVDREEILYGVIDIHRTRSGRALNQRNHVLRDRRADVYDPMLGTGWPASRS